MSENRSLPKNTRKHLEKPRSELRRADHGVTDQAWIKALLQRGAYGTLATSHQDQPFITPLSYVYQADERRLFFHGAQVGRLRANIAVNPRVCFNVTEFGQILLAAKAGNFNIEYNSVTVFGRAEPVTNPAKAEAVLQMLMDKYAPLLVAGQDYSPARPEDLQRTAVYQITIEEWSGKRQLNDDNAQPYDYPHPPLIQN